MIRDGAVMTALAGVRMQCKDALEALNSDLAILTWVAERVCDRMHTDRLKTYVVDRNINYTNYCISGCRFCAFFKEPGEEGGYVLSAEDILEKVDEAVALGATQILMQGGLHPELKIDYFTSVFRLIKSKYDVTLHCLSAPEIVHIAEISGLNVRETIDELKDAGLDSVPGGGAEILADDFRGQVSPRKCSASAWVEVMKTVAHCGLKATATMLFGMGESMEDRVAHLEKVRALQDETGVFTAFIPWTFQPDNTDLGGSTVGGHDYLRTLALSRMYLDNIPNIQASWVTQGGKIAQLALRGGANDIGSTMIEENVVAAAGVSHRMSEKELIELIHGAGFDAAKRNTQYDILETHSLLD